MKLVLHAGDMVINYEWPNAPDVFRYPVRTSKLTWDAHLYRLTKPNGDVTHYEHMGIVEHGWRTPIRDAAGNNA